MKAKCIWFIGSKESWPSKFRFFLIFIFYFLFKIVLTLHVAMWASSQWLSPLVTSGPIFASPIRIRGNLLGIIMFFWLPGRTIISMSPWNPNTQLTFRFSKSGSFASFCL
uniref:Uncharacterized protein n=1 Tax=Opuntia streptacantha TaxID=393608 RepID=A0A7C9DIM8_OPUST